MKGRAEKLERNIKYLVAFQNCDKMLQALKEKYGDVKSPKTGKYLQERTRILKCTTLQEVLGLSEGFIKGDVKAGFTKLARIFHPDKNQEISEAQEFFQVIETASKLL